MAKLALIALFVMTMATFTLAASQMPSPADTAVLVAELG